MADHRPLADIEADLNKAADAHKDAKIRSRTARSEETSTLNILNDIQKEFDAAVAALRKSGDCDTNWGSAGRGMRP